MRRVGSIASLTAVALFVLAQGSAQGQTIKVKESIAGTVADFDVDMNGDGLEEGQLGMCYGKGIFGEYTCKTYEESFVVPVSLGDPCEPGWVYAEIREFDPETGTTPSVFGHVQEFKNGDLLYWARDWSKTSYYCIDTSGSGKMTLKGYLKYDGGTGRFKNASGSVEWDFEIDTRIPHYLYGVDGNVQGLLTLED